MALWDQLVAFEYSIWVLCGALYLLDHVQAVGPRQLLCEERARGWRFRLHVYPFTMMGKDRYLLDPLRPWSGVFIMFWGEDRVKDKGLDSRAERRVLREAYRDLLRFQRYATVLRAISTMSALSLFAIGPLLTATHGLTLAVLAVVPIHVVLVGTAAVIFWRFRESLKLSVAKMVGVLAEAFICPPYMASLLKRLAVHYAIEAEGVALARALMPRSNFEEVRAGAVDRLDLEAGRVSGSDQDEEDAGRDYRERLRSWA